MEDSQFVPDMDDYIDEVDPDAYLQMEQDLHEEVQAMQASQQDDHEQHSQQQAGQSNKRRLDYAGYRSVAHSQASVASIVVDITDTVLHCVPTVR